MIFFDSLLCALGSHKIPVFPPNNISPNNIPPNDDIKSYRFPERPFDGQPNSPNDISQMNVTYAPRNCIVYTKNMNRRCTDRHLSFFISLC